MTKKECLYKKIFGRNKYASKLFNELTNSARYKYSRNFKACNGRDSRLKADVYEEILKWHILSLSAELRIIFL